MAVKRDENGKLLKGSVMNPSGKGGFAEHPEFISNGRWKKEDSISYQYNLILRMSPKEFAEYNKTPNKTMAQKIAVRRIADAVKSLENTKEVTDRTEGKAPQFIGMGDLDEYEKVLVEFVDAKDSDTD